MRKLLITCLMTIMPLLAWCDNITFADAEVKSICVANWDTDGDGELSYEEAAAVTSLNLVFEGKDIKTFDELQYFTGLTTIGNGEFDRASDFYRCYNLKSVVLPPTVTAIYGTSFAHTALETLRLPKSLKRIGSWAFNGMPNLATVYVEGEEAISWSYSGGAYGLFRECDALKDIFVPSSLVEVYKTADGWKDHADKIKGIDDPIPFADSNVKSICVANWDTNGDGELSYTEAAAVTDIGQVFKENTNITSFDELQYFTGLTSIGESSFYGCSNLASVIIPNTVTSIGNWAFNGCREIRSFSIPSSVTSISGRAFWETSITSLYIPKNVVSIVTGSFAKCYDLVSITVDEDNPVYDSRNNCNAIIETSKNNLIVGCQNTIIPTDIVRIDDAAFEGILTLKNITIPEGVTSLGVASLGGTGLTSIVIPESVTYIGGWAFNVCNDLVSVTMKRKDPIGIGYFSFSNRANATLYVPIGSKAAYEAADYWKEFKEIIEFVSDDPITFADSIVKDICVANWDTNGDGELSYVEAAAVTSLNNVFEGKDIKTFDELQYFTGLKSIGENAFYYCRGLTSIEIPNGVTSIGNAAFQHCSGLTSIEIPSSVTSIGKSAFSYCSGLTSIVIPNSVTSIGDYAFESCRGFTSIEIPNSVTSIGETAFVGCRGLTSITVDSKNSTYDSRDNCNAIIESGTNKIIAGCKNTIIPNSVTSIGNYAFYYCSGLTSIVIPNSVSSIGNYAFYYCSGLTSIVIPNSVTSIGERIFDHCSGLTSIEIPNSVTSIGYYAFYYCSGLTSIEIPNSVTSIDNTAFAGCSGLTSITVDSENITYDSRDNCNAIIETSTNKLIAGCKNTIIPNSVSNIGYAAFEGCSGLTSIVIPNSVSSIDNYAFTHCNGLISIEIPNSVTSIGNYAFYYCRGLVEVKVENPTPITITENTFSNRTNATLYVPRGSKASYVAADYWKEFKEIVEFVSDDPITFADSIVKEICVANWDTNGDGELSYAEAAAVTDIDMAFNGKNIESFDEFQYFTSVTTIKKEAFWRSNMKSIVIPKSVAVIESEAFVECPDLASITVVSDNSILDSRENCNAVIETSTNTLVLGCKNTVIPNTVTKIGEAAFGGKIVDNDNPISLTIPSSVTSIGSSAYYGCSIQSVTIPKSVTSIGDNVFNGNGNLTSIIVEEDNPVYDSRDNCNAIIETATNKMIAGCMNTVIPNTVTTIGWHSFYYSACPSCIDIPNSVTTIEHEAFRSCAITKIILPSSITEIADGAFLSEYDYLREVIAGMKDPVAIGEETFPFRENVILYVPTGSKAAYAAAEYWKDFKEIIESTHLSADTVKLLTGKTKSVSLSLENQDEIIMAEFELQLPNGFEIAKDEDGELRAELNSERIVKSHTLEIADHGNGKYKFLLYSTKNAAFKGNTGELLHFDLTCGKDVADGTYQATVSSIVLSNAQEEGVYPSDFTFDIIAVNAIPGDVNGDEVINGLDIVKIVGYIMGSPTQPFVEAAADLNEDEVINGLDLVKLVSLVLAQSSTQSAAGAKGMRSAARIAAKDLSLQHDESGMLTMGTEDGGKYILSQFTVVTDGNIKISDIITDGSHVVAYRQTADNRYSVVCYSETNAVFRYNSEMLKIHYTGNGSIRIQDAMMVDENENMVRFGAKMSGDTTGIDGVESREMDPTDIYTVGGKLVKKNATTLNGLPKGVYIVNGQKIIIN